MKALSINQPWAWTILFAGKEVENRTWRTEFRGEFYIHAGKRFDEEGLVWIGSNFPEIKLISDDILVMDGVVPYYLTSLSARKVKYMKAIEDYLDISFLMEFFPETEEEVERIKYGVYHNPTLYGSLVSLDSRATLIIADFDTEKTSYSKTYREIKRVCEKYSDEKHIISYAGTPIIIGWVNSEALPLVALAFVGFLAVMCIILGFSFKNIRGIIFPLGLGIIASIWAFGIQSILLEKVLVSSAGFLVPFIIMAAAACHSVQFLKRFLENIMD